MAMTKAQLMSAAGDAGREAQEAIRVASERVAKGDQSPAIIALLRAGRALLVASTQLVECVATGGGKVPDEAVEASEAPGRRPKGRARPPGQ